MSEQRCGTCKWFKSYDGSEVGKCLLPMSEALSMYLMSVTLLMHKNAGTACPTYEAKP